MRKSDLFGNRNLERKKKRRTRKHLILRSSQATCTRKHCQWDENIDASAIYKHEPKQNLHTYPKLLLFCENTSFLQRAEMLTIKKHSSQLIYVAAFEF